ncbi:MAG: HU family DNA-binding protein, partial [Pseudoxanthomonas sp.]
ADSDPSAHLKAWARAGLHQQLPRNRGTETMAKKSSAIASPLNKSQILADIATTTGLAKRDVGKVVEELAGVIERHIGKKGPGQFTLPGLFKIKTIRKPATKARKGINPFTKEEQWFAAKPASTKVKFAALKTLKDSAA